MTVFAATINGTAGIPLPWFRPNSWAGWIGRVEYYPPERPL